MKHFFFALLFSFFLTNCSNQDNNVKNKTSSGVTLPENNDKTIGEDAPGIGEDAPVSGGGVELPGNGVTLPGFFRYNTKKNCFWCGQKIDVMNSGVVILYNPYDCNIISEEVLKDIVSAGGKSRITDTAVSVTFAGKDAKYKRFPTDLLCSFKCYNELKDKYYKQEKDNFVYHREKNNIIDYYFFFVEK